MPWSWGRHDNDRLCWCLQGHHSNRHNRKGSRTAWSWEDHVRGIKFWKIRVVHSKLRTQGKKIYIVLPIFFFKVTLRMPLLIAIRFCQMIQPTMWWLMSLSNLNVQCCSIMKKCLSCIGQVNLFVDHSQIMDLECLRGRNLGKNHVSVLGSSNIILWAWFVAVLLHRWLDFVCCAMPTVVSGVTVKWYACCIRDDLINQNTMWWLCTMAWHCMLSGTGRLLKGKIAFSKENLMEKPSLIPLLTTCTFH